MAIDPVDGVKVVTVAELLQEPLIIPPYQRPYSWTPKTALQLTEDIRNAFKKYYDPGASEKLPYILGTVILHKDRNGLNIVDGQQRILTLFLLRKLLSQPQSGLLETNGEPSAAISLVRVAIASEVAEIISDQRSRMLDFLIHQCQLIRIETNDADEAFRIFDSQNYRGKALLPHDLLKAYHLREMAGVSPEVKIDIVEGWQNVPDEKLDRLFSTYLWRIRCWARGASAPHFTASLIDAFKGLSKMHLDSPFAQYHIRAQKGVGPRDEDAGNTGWYSGHGRFQLDAPIIAGQAFFDTTKLMLQELATLQEDANNTDRIMPFVSFQRNNNGEYVEVNSKARYRYVSELYLAALLFYKNRFGDENISQAKQILFRWAYALRIERERVQLKSVDNRASGKDGPGSAFVYIRNAVRSSELRNLPTPVGVNRENQNFEKDLWEVLSPIA